MKIYSIINLVILILYKKMLVLYNITSKNFICFDLLISENCIFYERREHMTISIHI